MKNFTLLSILLVSAIGFSQANPVNFETGGIGADWTFGVFANDTDPAVEVIANPDVSGVNTSATVAQFNAEMNGAEYAGLFSEDIGTFTLDATNSTVKISVWKPVVSDVGIKFEGPNGGIGELKVPNTLTNQWEELIFDFSEFIATPQAVDINRITIFPDFAARTQQNVIYFDDIEFSGPLSVNDVQIAKVEVYPNPTNDNWMIATENIEITKIKLFDIQGKLLSAMQPNTVEAQLDASALSKGVYFVQISTSIGSQSIKLLKQ